MSSTYTLHVAPHAAPGDPDALRRASLVRDGFSWGAFIAPMLWFFWHRHWVAGIASLVVVAAFSIGMRAAGIGVGAMLVAQVLLHLLNGFEGSSLRRWLYARRGRPAVDVVQASSLDEAEVKSFGRWIGDEAGPVASAASAYPTNRAPLGRGAEPVIELFPDAEGRP